jgi:hypothetical protein
MPAPRIGIAPMTAAERQGAAPRQAAPAQPHHTSGGAAAHPAAAKTVDDGGSRAHRSAGRFRAWLDTLPANLEGSRLAEKLLAIAELDLEELQMIDPPRGYGRD